MKSIIPVINELVGNRKINAVDARTLWEGLEVKKDFSDWWKVQASRLRLIEGKDFLPFKGEKKHANRKDYIVSLEMAKHIAMLSDTDKGFQVRDYFIKIEERFWKLQKRILEQKATSEWQIARETGKFKRRDLTDSIAPFIIYALEQGSKGTANNAYSNFSRLVNKNCGLNSGEREIVTPKMLDRIANMEVVVEMKIRELMSRKVYCKDIYAIIRDETLPGYVELVPFMGVKYLPAEQIKLRELKKQ